MNYDVKYEIRLARIEDIDSIMEFIDTYWRKGHILASNRDLFFYEHVDGETVSFLLAVERDSGAVAGILGYIPASKDLTKLDIWTGIWKVRGKSLPFLGMELYKRLQLMVGARSLLGVGDNQRTTGPLLRKLTSNFKTWRMEHYYLLAEREKYIIASISKQQENISFIPDISTKVVQFNNIGAVSEFMDLSSIQSCPYKDLWYIEHRYFEHPVFLYEIYGLQLGDKKALMVIRLQQHESANAARIVDYIGNQECFSGINKFIRQYLQDNDCEYADFYVHGFNKRFILSAGFVERKEGDVNVIPNYFSPFVKENVEIWCSGNIDGGLFVKADGDQDRPN